MKAKSIILRSVSGIVYVGIIVGCILLGDMATALLACLFAGLGSVELTKVLHGLTARRLPLVILDVASALSLALAAYGFPLVVWVFCNILRFVEELYAKDENPVKSLAISCFTQVYVALPCAMLLAVDVTMGIPRMLLAIFFLLWINDTGAFLVGSMIGRHRLFERISPKKSWEGFFGGLLFNLGAGCIFFFCCNGFFHGFFHNVWQWLGLAFVVTIFGTWGDLVESLIKRTVGIKDSGNLIPGHGGILDRIDSMLLAVPAAFIYFLFVAILGFPSSLF